MRVALATTACFVLAAQSAQGQAFFDITEIISGTNGAGRAATGYSETDNTYTETTVAGEGGAKGTFSNGPIQGSWEINLLSQPSIYDGATTNDNTPEVSTLATGTQGSGGSINRDNAWVYDVSPTQTRSGISVSLSGSRGANNNDPVELEYSGAPTNLTGSVDDPIPVLTIYPVPPAVGTIPYTSWGYGFNVYNHATDYTPSWTGDADACPAIMNEPINGQVNNFDNNDFVNNGQTIDSRPNSLSNQDWFVNLPPGVTTASITVEGFNYYDVIGFDTLYYDTTLSVLVEPATVAAGAFNNVSDAGDTIRVVYSLTNTGDVAVLNPSVTDPVLGTVSTAGLSGGIGTSGGYVSGDDDGNGELDVGETWQFEIIETIDAGEYNTTLSTLGGTQVTSTTSPRYCNPVPVRSEASRILNYPSFPAIINIVKRGIGPAEAFPFTFTNLTTTDHTFNLGANVGTGAVYTDNTETYDPQAVTDLDEDVVISEALPTGWNLDNASCDTASGGAFNGQTLTIPADDITPGADITCTFDNRAQVAVTVRKRMDDNQSGGTFNFTGTNTDLANFDLTVSAAQVATTDGYILDPDADFTITELVGPEYINTDINCVNLTTNAQQNITPNISDGDSGTTLAAAFYGPGDEVRCTFRNQHRTTTLTVEKEWENMDGAAHSVNISASGIDLDASNSVATSATQATTSTADGVQPLANLTNIQVFAGETISLTEDVLAGFGQSLSCVGASPTGTTNATLVVPDNPTPITCTYNNIKFPNQDNWVRTSKQTNGATGAFDFTATNIQGGGAFTLDTASSNPVSSAFYLIDTVNQPVTLFEPETPGFTFDSVICRNYRNPTAPVELTPAQFTVNTVAGDGTTVTIDGSVTGQLDKIFCDFVNEANQYPLTVDKDWVDGQVDTSSTTITATGNTTETGTATAPTDDAGVVTTQFYVNGEVTISETTLPNYTASLTCDDASAGISGNNPWTVDTNGNTTGLTCTVTNTRNTGTLTLAKDWIDSLNGDQVTIDIRTPGAAGTRLAHTSTSTGGDQSTDGGTMTIYGGESLTITEGNLAADGYDQTLACTGGATVADNATGNWSVDIPDTFTGDVDCTVTNDRAAGTLIIQKNVTNATEGTFTFASNTLDPGNFVINTVGGTGTADFVNIAPDTYDVSEAALAGWNLVGATCDNGSGTFNAATATLTNITVADEETVTCSFNNRRNTSRFRFEKTWIDAPATHTAQLTATGDEITLLTWDTPGTAGLATETVDSTAFDYTVYGNETLTLAETFSSAGYTTSDWTCEGESAGVSSGAVPVTNGNEILIPPAPPEIITCSVTNTFEAVPVTISKAWVDAETGDTTTLAFNGLIGNNAAATANTPTETDTDILSDEAVPGESYSLNETLLPNYEATLVCTGATVGASSIAGGNLSFPLDVSATATEVDCTLTNTRRSATLTLDKVWVDALVGEVAEITAQTSSEAAQSFTYAATAADEAATVGTITFYAGDTLSVSEMALTGYDTTLVCSDPAITITGANGTVDLPDTQPADTTCTWTNTRRHTDITVVKNWRGADAGDAVDITVTGGDGTPGTVNAAAATDGDSATTVRTFEAFAGETLTFSEAPNAAYNAGAFTCDSGLSVNASGALTMPATPPATATCEITNKRNQTTLNLAKTWVNAAANETVDLSAAEGANVVIAATPADANGTDAVETEALGTIATATVFAGDTITLSEGPLATGYTASLSCPGVTLTNVSGDGTGAEFIVPDTDGGEITCTWTNTRASATLTVAKVWVDADAAEATTLTVDGLGTDISAAANADASASPGTETLTNVATMDIYGGETLTLSETINPNYTQVLDCGAGPIGTDGAGTFDVPITPVDVTCTWTNTRNTATLTLQKVWEKADANEATSITVNSPLLGTNILNADADPDAANASETLTLGTLTLYAGESVSLSETAIAGYDQVLDCGAGPIGTDGADTITIPATPTNLTCVWTNTRRSTLVSVQKNWVGADAGDSAALELSGVLNAPAAATINAAASGDQNQAVFTDIEVFAGETLTLAETAVDAGYTASGLSCDTLALTLAGATSGTVTLSDTPPATALCQITNTRNETTLNVAKIWVNAGAGETVDLSATVNGTDLFTPIAATADGTEAVESEDLGTLATATVAAGNTVVLSEGPLPAGYAVSLSCPGVTLANVSADGTGAEFIVPDTDGEEITCTWTNTRLEATLTVEKTWVDADAAEATTLSVDGIGSDISAAAPADANATPGTETLANVATMTIYAGETLTLSETVNPNYTQVLDCGAGPVGTDGAGTFSVPDTPADVTCTWTNTRNTATLTLQKVWAKADANEATTITVDSPLLGTNNLAANADGDATDASETLPLGTLTLYAGEIVSLSESLIAGYDQVLDCGAGPIGTDGADTLTVPATPTDLTCTWTNTRRSTLVTLEKVWIDASAGHSATLEMTGTQNAPGATTVNAPASAASQTQNVYMNVEVFEGETLSIAETAIEPGYSVGPATCDTLTLTATGAGAGTVTLGDTPPATALCQVQNTRTVFELYLTKVWNNAAPNETVTLTATGSTVPGATDVSEAATADGTEAVETETLNNLNPAYEVAAGDTITITETGLTGGYTAQLACFDGLTPVPIAMVGTDTGTILVPNTLGGPALNCTWTNTRNTAELTLAKTWINADANESVTLSATSPTLASGSAAAIANATPGVETESIDDVVIVTVYSGDTLTLGEDTVDANYTTALACSGGSDYTLTGDQLAFGDAPADMECRWTNTRREATLTLVKDWVDADNNEATTLSVTSAMLGNPTFAANADGDGTNDSESLTAGTVPLYGGETLALSETTMPGYTQELACTNANGTVLTGTTGGNLAVDDVPLDTTCTWTNTRNSTLVTLQKNWIGASTGDGATLDVSGGDETPGAQPITAANDGDYTQTVGAIFKVFAGETITFSEPTLDTSYTAGAFSCDTLALDAAGTVIVGNTPPTTATCEITNERITIELSVSKTWVNGAATAPATLTVDNNDGDGTNDISIAANADADGAEEVETLADLAIMTVSAGQTIDLAETGLPNGYSTTLVCTDGPATLLDVTTTDGQFVVPDTLNSTEIECTWTNTRNTAELTLAKTWINADANESVILSATSPTLSSGSAAATANATPGVETESIDDVVILTVYSGDTLTLAEDTVAANYSTSLACSGGSDYTLAGDQLAIGNDPADMECRWTNTRRQAILTFEVVWVDADENEVADLNVTSPMLGSTTISVDADGDGTNDTQNINAGTVTLFGGETVTLSETTLPGYTQTLECTDADGNVLSAGTGGTFTADDLPLDTTCVWTNTRNSTLVTLQKNWIGASTGDGATLDVSGGDETPGAQPITAANDGDFKQTVGTTFKVFAGETITFSEPVLDSSYEAGDFTCDTLALDAAGTVIVGSTPPANATCEITNTRMTVDLNVSKQWINGGPNAAATLTVDNNDGDATNDISVAANADADGALEVELLTDIATMTVAAGETVDLAEINLAPGYDTTLICTEGPDTLVNVAATSGQFIVPDVFNTTEINCLWTNTRQTTTIQLDKAWINADGGDSATLNAVGLETTTGNTLVPGVGFTATSNDTNVAGMTVYAGETVVLSETALSPGYDMSDWGCRDDGGALAVAGGTDLTVPDTLNGAIICEITNTRLEALITVNKDWENADAGAAATIEVTGGENTPGTQGVTAAIAGNSTVQVGAAFTAYAGERLTFAETALDAGYTASDFVCPGLTLDAGGTTTVPDTPTTDYICTITNTRNQAELTIEKVWINAAPNVSVDPTATGQNGTITFTATSDNDTDIETETYTHTTTLTVFAGEDITLTEGAVPAGYTAALVCDDDGTDLTLVAGATLGEALVQVPDTPTAMTCTWTNTRRAAQLILNKTWENAAIAETTDFYANGMNTVGPAAATANNTLEATETISTVTFMTIFAGETVTLSEDLVPGYDASLSCDQGTVSADGSAGNAVLTVPNVPASPLECTWVNTRRETTFQLDKVWENAHAGAIADLEALGATTQIPGQNVVDPPVTVTSTFDEITPTNVTAAGGNATQTAGTITAYAGETFILNETNLSTGYTAGAWECRDDGGAITVLNGNEATIPDTPNGTLVCAITNTRNGTPLTIDKQWTDAIVGNSATITAAGIDTATGLTTAGAVDELQDDVVTSTIYAGETLQISETALNGYDTVMVCDGGATQAGANPWDVSVPFDQAAPVNCVITNDRRPTIQIGEITLTSFADFTFAITNTTPGADMVGTSAPNVEELGTPLTVADLSQAVVLSQDGQFGWSNVSIECRDQNGPIAANTGSDTITLSPAVLATAEDVVCTFTNNVSVDDMELAKSVDPQVASAGETVTYTLTIQNTSQNTSTGGLIEDLLPLGLSYVPGSAQMRDGTASAAVEPSISGQTLTWPYDAADPAPQDSLNAGETMTITFDALVEDGTTRDAVNTVQHLDPNGALNSTPATALLTIIEDPGMVCNSIIGTVWDVTDLDDSRDEFGNLSRNEQRRRGIPGARIVTTDGQVVTTDDNGRYSIPCVRIRGARGAETRVNNVPLKLVESSLPAGFETVGNNPLLVTTTPGKVAIGDFPAEFTGVDNKTCRVPFSAEEAEEKAAEGIYSLTDNGRDANQCRDTFWFVTAQIRAEGDGYVPGQNRTATDGVLTAYFKGYITGKTLLTLGYEARGSEFSDFTSGALAPDVERILDEIEDEDLFPIFADQSVLEDDTPTLSGVYIRLEREDDRFVFGTTDVSLQGNDLAPVEREIYGAVLSLNWDGDEDGSNAADGTPLVDGGDGNLTIYAASDTFSRSSEVFTGLGGSTFFLSRTQIVPASLSAEIRVTNTITGQVLDRQTLTEGPDFWVNEGEGVLRLSQPLLSFLPGVQSGTTLALYVTYDYIPDGFASGGREAGGRVEQALSDNVTVGATAVVRDDGTSDSRVIAGDVEWRFGESRVRVNIAQSEGTTPGVLVSNDGGASFTLLPGTTGTGTATTVAIDLDEADSGLEGFSLSFFIADVDDSFQNPDGNQAANSGLSLGLETREELGNGLTATGSLAAGNIGDQDQEIRAGLGLEAEVSDTTTLSGGVMSASDQSGDALGVEAGVSVSVPEDNATVAVTVTETLSDNESGPDLDAVEIIVTQELENGGSIGLTAREDAGGSQAGVTLTSDDAGPFQTYASVDQSGDDFGDLGNAWATGGFRYQSGDALSIFGETRQALSSPEQRNQLALTYDDDMRSLGVSVIHDQVGNFETNAVSLSYGWTGEQVNGTLRLERGVQEDLTTGTLRDTASFSYKGVTFNGRDLETSLSIDYTGSVERGGTGANDAHNGEIEGAIAYRTGPEDRLVLLLLYKGEYDLTPTGTNGAESYNHRLRNTAKLDLTYQVNDWLTLGAAYSARSTATSPTRLTDLGVTEVEQLGVIRIDTALGERVGLVLEGRAYANSNLTNIQVGTMQYIYFEPSENLRVSLGYSQNAIGPQVDSLGAVDEGWFVEFATQY